MCRCGCKKTVTSPHGMLEAHQGALLRLHVWRLLPASGMVAAAGRVTVAWRVLGPRWDAAQDCAGLRATVVPPARSHVCEGRPITREGTYGPHPVVPAFSPGFAAGAPCQSPGPRASALHGHHGGRVEPATRTEDGGPPGGHGCRGQRPASRGTRREARRPRHAPSNRDYWGRSRRVAGRLSPPASGRVRDRLRGARPAGRPDTVAPSRGRCWPRDRPWGGIHQHRAYRHARARAGVWLAALQSARGRPALPRPGGRLLSRWPDPHGTGGRGPLAAPRSADRRGCRAPRPRFRPLCAPRWMRCR
jgi:hypothetical protein